MKFFAHVYANCPSHVIHRELWPCVHLNACPTLRPKAALYVYHVARACMHMSINAAFMHASLAKSSPKKHLCLDICS